MGPAQQRFFVQGGQVATDRRLRDVQFFRQVLDVDMAAHAHGFQDAHETFGAVRCVVFAAHGRNGTQGTRNSEYRAFFLRSSRAKGVRTRVVRTR